MDPLAFPQAHQRPIIHFFILMGSLSVPAAGTLAILTVVLLICMPALRFIASWVEGKENTFTLAGAAFSGFM